MPAGGDIHLPPFRGLPAGLHPGRTDVAEEFLARPFGRHSPDLQGLLDYMRSAPIPGKYFLWMVEPHAKWVLARFTDTEPLAVERFDDVAFEDILDAERHVFRRRWSEIFGRDLEVA